MRGFFKPTLVDPWGNLLEKATLRGPFCQMCRHYVLEEPCDRQCPKHGIELLENTIGMPKTAILARVWCHGDEEVQRLDMGTVDYDEHDLEKAIKRMKWFQPKERVQA